MTSCEQTDRLGGRKELKHWPTGAALLGLVACALMPSVSLADEGGVSFWLPGMFGSLAAAPSQPGWSLAKIYYHASVSGGGDVALEREFELAGYLSACPYRPG